jgi:predicted dehydrogenase
MGSENVRGLSAAVRMDNGATGALIGTCHVDFKLPLYELTLAFEHGRIHLRDLDGDLEFLDYRTLRQSVHSLPREVSRWDQYRASFVASLAAYLESIRQDGPPPVPGVAGLLELQVEAAIQRSLAQARPVEVATEFPLEV